MYPKEIKAYIHSRVYTQMFKQLSSQSSKAGNKLSDKQIVGTSIQQNTTLKKKNLVHDAG
jgi:hypothetical protein